MPILTLKQNTLLTKVAERVLVKGGKLNLMTGEKTGFLIVLSTTLCASVKGWGNCVWIPWEWIGLCEKFLDLKVDNTSCAS